MKIVLVGYMGSGKTTIGKLIAKDLKLNFVDLDEYIDCLLYTSPSPRDRG